jgi:hypothetical protein
MEQTIRRLPVVLGSVQRKSGHSCGCSACRVAESIREPSTHTLIALQRLIGNQATIRLLAARSVKSVIAESGEKMDPTTRRSMEQRFRTSFADVRIHRDSGAAASAKALEAHAYTAGNHIVFAQGRFDPSSREGQQTLAHELTHVIQQRDGSVSGMSIGEGVSVSEPDDPFERAAEDKAKQVVEAAPPQTNESGGSSIASSRQTNLGRLVAQRQSDAGTDGSSSLAVEQIVTDEDISYLQQIIATGQQQAGPDQTQDQQTAQALSVHRLLVQRWSVWTCFGDKANVAAAAAATVAAIGTGIAALLAPDPTTITKWVALGLIAAVIAGIAWLISAIIGLRNCYKAQDDAAQHQREIDSLQRQIDQLQRTVEKLKEVQGQGPAPTPAPAPAPSGQ